MLICITKFLNKITLFFFRILKYKTSFGYCDFVMNLSHGLMPNNFRRATTSLVVPRKARYLACFEAFFLETSLNFCWYIVGEKKRLATYWVASLCGVGELPEQDSSHMYSYVPACTAMHFLRGRKISLSSKELICTPLYSTEYLTDFEIIKKP